MPILNACFETGKMVDENVCKDCFLTCSHAGQPTTAERIAQAEKTVYKDCPCCLNRFDVDTAEVSFKLNYFPTDDLFPICPSCAYHAELDTLIQSLAFTEWLQKFDKLHIPYRLNTLFNR